MSRIFNENFSFDKSFTGFKNKIDINDFSSYESKNIGYDYRNPNGAASNNSSSRSQSKKLANIKVVNFLNFTLSIILAMLFKYCSTIQNIFFMLFSIFLWNFFIFIYLYKLERRLKIHIDIIIFSQFIAFCLVMDMWIFYFIVHFNLNEKENANYIVIMIIEKINILKDFFLSNLSIYIFENFRTGILIVIINSIVNMILASIYMKEFYIFFDLFFTLYFAIVFYKYKLSKINLKNCINEYQNNIAFLSKKNEMLLYHNGIYHIKITNEDNVMTNFDLNEFCNLFKNKNPLKVNSSNNLFSNPKIPFSIKNKTSMNNDFPFSRNYTNYKNLNCVKNEQIIKNEVDYQIPHRDINHRKISLNDLWESKLSLSKNFSNKTNISSPTKKKNILKNIFLGPQLNLNNEKSFTSKEISLLENNETESISKILDISRSITDNIHDLENINDEKDLNYSSKINISEEANNKKINLINFLKKGKNRNVRNNIKELREKIDQQIIHEDNSKDLLANKNIFQNDSRFVGTNNEQIIFVNKANTNFSDIIKSKLNTLKFNYNKEENPHLNIETFNEKRKDSKTFKDIQSRELNKNLDLLCIKNLFSIKDIILFIKKFKVFKLKNEKESININENKGKRINKNLNTFNPNNIDLGSTDKINNFNIEENKQNEKEENSPIIQQIMEFFNILNLNHKINSIDEILLGKINTNVKSNELKLSNWSKLLSKINIKEDFSYKPSNLSNIKKTNELYDLNLKLRRDSDYNERPKYSYEKNLNNLDLIKFKDKLPANLIDFGDFVYRDQIENLLEESSIVIKDDQFSNIIKKSRVKLNSIGQNKNERRRMEENIFNIKAYFTSIKNNQENFILFTKNKNKIKHSNLFSMDIYIKLRDNFNINQLESSSIKKFQSEEISLMKKNLAKIVHEFKTPINTIIGLISETIISKKNLACSSNKSKLKLIKNLSNHLIFLAGDIINFCNMGNEHASFNLNIERINVKKSVQFCYEILIALLNCQESKKGIRPILHFDNDLDLYEINTDETRLKQIILNFVSNSIKFTKCGSIKLICKIKKNVQKLKISVVDSGIGIRKEDQAKLFNDFMMIEGESTKFLNKQGSGLGLSLSKYLADKLNHEIKFKSKYNEGSTFSLSINAILKKNIKNLRTTNNEKHISLCDKEIIKSDKFKTQFNFISMPKLDESPFKKDRTFSEGYSSSQDSETENKTTIRFDSNLEFNYSSNKLIMLSKRSSRDFNFKIEKDKESKSETEFSDFNMNLFSKIHDQERILEAKEIRSPTNNQEINFKNCNILNNFNTNNIFNIKNILITQKSSNKNLINKSSIDESNCSSVIKISEDSNYKNKKNKEKNKIFNSPKQKIENFDPKIKNFDNSGFFDLVCKNCGEQISILNYENKKSRNNGKNFIFNKLIVFFSSKFR